MIHKHSNSARYTQCSSSSCLACSHQSSLHDMQGIKHSKAVQRSWRHCWVWACVTSLNNWCASKRLQLNTKKTEVMWFGSATNLSTKTFSSDPTSYHHLLLSVISECSSTQNSTWSRILVEYYASFYHLRRLRAVRIRFFATRLL